MLLKSYSKTGKTNVRVQKSKSFMLGILFCYVLENTKRMGLYLRERNAKLENILT